MSDSFTSCRFEQDKESKDGCRLNAPLYRQGESGRSMVEMLGVLAIIGVLSVGGIAGYTTAMNKHRANKLLQQASFRAVVVSTQIQKGIDNPSLLEFTDNTFAGATFTGLADWNKNTDKRFSLTLTGVDEKVCTQMKATVGQNSIIREINEGCTTITYNNDLTTTAIASDYKTEESCTNAGKEWCGTACADSCGPTCPEGTSENGAGGFAKNVDTLQCYCNGENEKWSGIACNGILPESTCSDNTDCKKGEYCNYYDYSNYTLRSGSYRDGPNANSGVCLTADVASGTNDYGFTLSTKYMDWFSVKKFCESLNKTMVSLDDFHITSREYNCNPYATPCTFEEGYSWDNVKTGNLSNTYWWTKDLYPSPYYFAYYVGANRQYMQVSKCDYGSYALCK